MLARYKVIIRKTVNLNIKVIGDLKMKWLTSLPNIFNKELTWLKRNKWAVIYFDVRVIYICTTKFKNLRHKSVWKWLTCLFNQKVLMFDVKGFLDLPQHAIHRTCKISQLIILNVFKCKMSRFVQFWCNFNTHRIVKTCPFRFLNIHKFLFIG